jgi:hypothetical protein
MNFRQLWLSSWRRLGKKGLFQRRGEKMKERQTSHSTQASDRKDPLPGRPDWAIFAYIFGDFPPTHWAIFCLHIGRFSAYTLGDFPPTHWAIFCLHIGRLFALGRLWNISEAAKIFCNFFRGIILPQIWLRFIPGDFFLEFLWSPCPFLTVFLNSNSHRANLGWSFRKNFPFKSSKWKPCRLVFGRES